MEPAKPVTLGQGRFEDLGIWRKRFDRFEEVLRLNIFLLNAEGQVLIPPQLSADQALVPNRWGQKFLNPSFGFISYAQGQAFLDTFEASGNEPLHACNPFDFCLLAKPLMDQQGKVFAYLIIGPVIKGKKWPDEKYLRLAERLGLSVEGFLDEIYGMAHLSQAAAEAILNLLAEVVKHDLDLGIEKQKFDHLVGRDQGVSRAVAQVAQELYEDIQKDELLVMILDETIQLSHSEGGSVMVLDQEKGEMVVRVSRGLKNKQSILQSHHKIGEGISGKVAQDQEPLLIRGTDAEGGIQHLLKRPDIKTSLVIPLIVKKKSIGVLNLYTCKDNPSFVNSLADVNQIAAFIAQVLDQKS